MTSQTEYSTFNRGKLHGKLNFHSLLPLGWRYNLAAHTKKSKWALTKTLRQTDPGWPRAAEHTAMLQNAFPAQVSLASVQIRNVPSEEGGHATDNVCPRLQEVLNDPHKVSGSQQSITSSVNR